MKGYVEIFETMLDSLRFFAESEKPLNVKEIECKFGLHTRTAQRIAKSLEEAGWLTSKKTGCGNLFTATDKAKALFKKDEFTEQSVASEFIKNHTLVKAKEVIDNAPNHWAFCYYSTKTCEFTRFMPSYDGINVLELKRLVKSLELFEHFGPLEILKPFFILTDKSIGYTHVYKTENDRFCFLDESCDFIPAHAISINRVMQAIKDHVSIYGPQLKEFKVGDKVEPIDPMYTLASGCERYPHAYVVSVNPFRLMSERGDMYWSATVMPENFKLIASNGVLPEGVLNRMKREFLIEDCGVLSE